MTVTVQRQRWLDGREMLPRFREVGDLTLDLFHRDGRIDARWLHLFPREFELLWFLAEAPGIAFSRRILLAEVWRVPHEPETNTVAVHVARTRAKLSAFGLDGLLATDTNGDYFLNALPGPSAFMLETAR